MELIIQDGIATAWETIKHYSNFYHYLSDMSTNFLFPILFYFHGRRPATLKNFRKKIPTQIKFLCPYMFQFVVSLVLF